MSPDVIASDALAITISFPRGVYSGAVLGVAEDLPAHSRVHEAFVAAAAGGPAARAERNVLVALDEHRQAVEWLEDNEPLGLIAPAARMTVRTARRYRWRASPVVPVDTPFEPFSALAGPVVYLWPSAPDGILAALVDLASEVTHVGRADSLVQVRIERTDVTDGPGLYLMAAGRGPGRVMRIARAGRFQALARAHAETGRPGRHGPARIGRQVPDEVVPVNEERIELRRFARTQAAPLWPFDEVWQLEIDGTQAALESIGDERHRVAAAVGIHRALVRRLGEAVPALVSGRAGDGPLRGAGHLAIHVLPDPVDDGDLVACLAIPTGAIAADREQLAGALTTPLRCRLTFERGDARRLSLTSLTRRSPVAFWSEAGSTMRTAVPLVIDVNGGPRQGGWTLDDAVVCSVGFAMRGVLERSGLTWGSGWTFRRELVGILRERYGVRARAARVHSNALRFVHRVGDGELVVASNAIVDLGSLAAADGAGFLALGRARHLGGGLLVPVRRVG